LPGKERRGDSGGAACERKVEGHQLEDEEDGDRDDQERVPLDPQRDQAERHRDHGPYDPC
jgi:hypothetical protein